MTTEAKTIAQFIEENEITIAKCQFKHRDYEGANHYTVTLKNKEGRLLTTPYFMRSAHTKPPEADDILNCLALDSSGVDNARDFADWCSEYGYDNIQKAKRIHKACETQAKRLKQFLGDELYNSLLYNVEGL